MHHRKFFSISIHKMTITMKLPPEYTITNNGLHVTRQYSVLKVLKHSDISMFSTRSNCGTNTSIRALSNLQESDNEEWRL